MALWPTTVDAETVSVQKGLPSTAKTWQVLELVLCESTEEEKKKSIYKSFFPCSAGIGTEVVIWLIIGDCLQQLVLVRQNSSFWILCRRSLENWLCGWMEQAWILSGCWLYACFAFPQIFWHLSPDQIQPISPVITKTKELNLSNRWKDGAKSWNPCLERDSPILPLFHYALWNYSLPFCFLFLGNLIYLSATQMNALAQSVPWEVEMTRGVRAVLF